MREVAHQGELREHLQGRTTVDMRVGVLTHACMASNVHVATVFRSPWYLVA